MWGPSGVIVALAQGPAVLGDECLGMGWAAPQPVLWTWLWNPSQEQGQAWSLQPLSLCVSPPTSPCSRMCTLHPVHAESTCLAVPPPAFVFPIAAFWSSFLSPESTCSFPCHSTYMEHGDILPGKDQEEGRDRSEHVLPQGLAWCVLSMEVALQ